MCCDAGGGGINCCAVYVMQMGCECCDANAMGMRMRIRMAVTTHFLKIPSHTYPIRIRIRIALEVGQPSVRPPPLFRPPVFYTTNSVL